MIVNEYEINAYPTFVVISNGEKVQELKGGDAAKLEQLFQKYA